MKLPGERFSDLLIDLLEEYPRSLCYSLDEGLEFPTETERVMISTFGEAMPLSQETIDMVREGLSFRNAYNLVMFAVRTAIYAARNQAPELLSISISCFIIDDGLVDWRDILVALSIIEVCANEVGMNFKDLMLTAVKFAVLDRRELVVEGYLARTPEMRGVDVMGYKIRGAGETLDFVENK